MRAKPPLGPPRRDHPLSAGLALALPLREGTGDPRDAAHGLSAARTGSVAWVAGPRGWTLDFAGGLSDYLTVAADPRLDLTGRSYSVAITFTPTGAGSTGYRVLANSGGSDNRKFYFLVDPSGVLWRWNAFDTGIVVPDGSEARAVYTFEAASDTSGTERFHVWLASGAHSTAARTGTVPATAGVDIHVGAVPTMHSLQGRVDGLAAWIGRVLSADEARTGALAPAGLYRSRRRWWLPAAAAAPPDTPAVTIDRAAFLLLVTAPADTSATGTLAATLDAVTLTASGSSAAPGAASATLAATLDAVTLTASGSSAAPGVISATLAATLGSVTLAGAGTAAAPSAADATLSVTLADVGSAAAGAFAASSTLASTLGPVTLAGSGQATAPGIAAGTLAATLADITLAGAGTAVSPPTGALAATLGDVTLVAAGTSVGGFLTDLDVFRDIAARLEATGHFDAVALVQGDQEPEFSGDHRRVAIVRDPGEYEEPWSDTGTQDHVHEFEIAVRVRAPDDEAASARLKWLERVAKSLIVGQSLGPGLTLPGWTTLEADRIEFAHPDRTSVLRGSFTYSFEPGTWDVTEPT